MRTSGSAGDAEGQMYPCWYIRNRLGLIISHNYICWLGRVSTLAPPSVHLWVTTLMAISRVALGTHWPSVPSWILPPSTPPWLFSQSMPPWAIPPSSFLVYLVSCPSPVPRPHPEPPPKPVYSMWLHLPREWCYVSVFFFWFYSTSVRGH